MKTTITMALICHNDQNLYDKFQKQYKKWTRKPDELIELGNVALSPGMIVRPDYKDKGYDKRQVALDRATKDWIFFANYDNIHHPQVLEKCEEAMHDDTMIVYFRADGKYWPHAQATHFAPYNSGIDNFMVRTSLLRSVGIRQHIGDFNDGNTSNPPDVKIINVLRTIVPEDSIEYIPEFLLRIY